jgi:2-polyprenyl-3-methyl-5-hydroxy-6-metoxy-1,4-benzoquinol methylase
MAVHYKTSAKEEWNERTSLAVAKKYSKPEFDSILKKYLPISSKKTCLEIGAIPGGFLAYFKKEFHYKITGIDFAENKKVFDETMKINRIKDYKFISADIKNIKTNKKYDVVSSFGFIEHFDDFEEIISKHIELLAEDGYLVISLPNFRNLQYVYRVLFDRQNLKIHNLDSMKINKLNSIIASKGLTKIFSGHLGGIELWYDSPIKNDKIFKIRHKLVVSINKLKHKVPNSFLYSPMMLLVYKK